MDIIVKDGNNIGTDNIVEHENELDINNQEDEQVYPMNGIKVDKGFYSVFELKRRYDAKEKRIILDSDFQRETVWNNIRKSELVESILMGLPLPIFYFNQDKYGRLIVVDGRQRLTALFEFMDNKYPLRKLKVLPELNEKKFEDLSPGLEASIEDYQISAHVILPPTPDRIKFDIFDRVNRGGVQLNKQEIRNALYQGEATALLKRLAESEEFRRATGDAFQNEKRMKDKYLLTRFLTFLLQKQKLIKDDQGADYIFKTDIDEFLGRGMDTINNLQQDDVVSLEKMTKDILNNCYYYMGKDGFRLQKDGKKSPINMNLFETLMFIMIHIDEHVESDIPYVRNKVEQLIHSEEYIDNIGNHRDSQGKLEWRLDMAFELGREIGEYVTRTEN